MHARAVNVHVSAAAAAGRADGTGGAMAAAEGGRARKKDVFWMKDPKTGYWVPENRFDEVDAVELRDRLLHCK